MKMRMNRKAGVPAPSASIVVNSRPDPEDEEAVREILEEDARRRERNNSPFDPVTGESSVGERFRIELPDFIIPTQFLPVSMREEPLVKALLEAGSFKVLSDGERDNIVGSGPYSSKSAARLKAEFLMLRLRHDFPFWAATAVNIKRKGGGNDIAFRLNRPQRRLVECFERQRLAGEPIRIILLKARQWGGSTCVQIYMAWLQLMHSVGLNSLIIAHQGAGSDEIKDMFDRMLRSYPPELLYGDDPMPPKSADGTIKMTENVGRSGQSVRVKHRNCKIKIGTAERPDSCRGGDYNLVHLSEVGIWRSTDGKTPEDIVRSACGGVLLAPMTMIVYESTANGTGNFFHREYLAASRGESQFQPLFVAWHEIEQYHLKIEDEEERRQLALRLWQGRESMASGDRSESGRYLWNLWRSGADLEGIKWYVAERAKYNDHARMAAEYPSDDAEAFAHSGALVFYRDDVERLRYGCRAPLFRGEIESHAGEESTEDLYLHETPGGGLEVWELPNPDGRRITDRYAAVMDIGGRTSRADWSVIAVIDRGLMAEGGVPRIVAQWRGHCDWDILAWKAAKIAAFYDEALLIIESNSLESRDPSRQVDGGELPSILCQIRDSYLNLYMRRAGIENLREGPEMKVGFHTNAATKPMVITSLIRAVREGLYEERSDAALDEFLCYERRPNGSYGAIISAHDDILMTRAIGLHIALHEMEPPRLLPPAGSRRKPRRGRPMTEACF